MTTSELGRAGRRAPLLAVNVVGALHVVGILLMYLSLAVLLPTGFAIGYGEPVWPLLAEARSGRVRPPGTATVPRSPPRGTPKRPLPGVSSIARSAGPPDATSTARPPRGSGSAGERGERAVGGHHLKLRLDGRAAAQGLRCARRRRAGRPRTSSMAPAADRARPRRGAAPAPSSVHVTDATRARSARARIADREGDEQPVAGDHAAVGVADAHGQSGRDLHRQLDRPAAARRWRRTTRWVPVPRRRPRAARAARRAGRQAGGRPSRAP